MQTSPLENPFEERPLLWSLIAEYIVPSELTEVLRTIGEHQIEKNQVLIAANIRSLITILDVIH